MTDTLVDVTIPKDPKLPAGDVLLDIFQRITNMSDALFAPEGMLQTRLAAHGDQIKLNHMAQMNILRKILAEVLEMKVKLEDAEEEIEKHSAQLTLVKHLEIQ